VYFYVSPVAGWYVRLANVCALLSLPVIFAAA
jgi:hypothetical protein